MCRIFLQETYEVLDAKIYDTFESSTTNSLTHNDAVTIENSTDWHHTGTKSGKVYVQLSTGYFGYGENSPSSFIGNTLHYDVYCNADSTGKLSIMINQAGLWNTYNLHDVAVGENHLTGNINIPSNATGFRLRFHNFASGTTVYVDDFLIY